jgi:hypothetical protein
MRRRFSFLRRQSTTLVLALTLAGLASNACPAHAAMRLLAPETFAIPSVGVVPGDLAVGDVEGDGVPEIATYASDLRVHVYSRVEGRWTEVYVSTAVALDWSTAPVPNVRFTDVAEIAPGPGYGPGQFLFSVLTMMGNHIMSIRCSNGVWSEQVVVSPQMDYPCRGRFSPPVLLQAEYNTAPKWRLAVPGIDCFDPPMGVLLPEPGQPAPYPAVKHTFGGGGYCSGEVGVVSAADAADVDGNGINELAIIINYHQIWVASTLSANSLPGPGCWSFEKFALSSSIYGSFVQLIAGNFDADAAGDFVARNDAGEVSLMRGTPGAVPYVLTTTALPAVMPGGPAYTTDMDVADLDGDGDLDIVVAYSSPAGYKLLHNDGTGTFTEAFAWFPDIADTVGNVALADVDGDDVVDLVLSMTSVTNPRVLIISGRGDGYFGPANYSSLGTLDPASLAIADFDGDLFNDIAVGGLDLDDTDGSQPIQIWMNPRGGSQGDPNLVASQYVYNEYVRRMVPCRPSPTDSLGLAIIGTNSFATVQGNGDGTMQPFAAPWVDLKIGMDAADMDGDGLTETIQLEWNLSGEFVYIENPLGFVGWLGLAATYDGVRALDWNSDGLLDLVLLNMDLGQLEVRLMDPGALWTFPTTLTYPVTVPLDGWVPGGWSSFIVMPFAGGSTLRTVVVRSGTASPASQVEVFLNEGTGPARRYDVSTSASRSVAGLAGGDLDGDGVPDLMVGENVEGRSSVLTLLRGVAGVPDSFETNATFELQGRVLADLAIGDVTGDGFDDLVTITTLGVTGPRVARGPARAVSAFSTGELAVFRARSVPVPTAGVGPDPRPVAPPARLALAIAPNPARNDQATITLALPSAGVVDAALFDLAGRKVREVFRGERPAGTCSQRIPLRDASGRGLGAGVYFLRVQAGRDRVTRRLVVVR